VVKSLQPRTAPLFGRCCTFLRCFSFHCLLAPFAKLYDLVFGVVGVVGVFGVFGAVGVVGLVSVVGRVFNDLIDAFTKSNFKSFWDDFVIFKIRLKYGDLI
jgi:hypothetical protein